MKTKYMLHVVKEIKSAIVWLAMVSSLPVASCGAAPLWTEQSFNTGGNFYAVAYGTPSGSPLFVAVGEDAQFYKSANGTSWSADTTTINVNAVFYSVAYGTIGGQGYYVAVGDLSGNAITAYSTDGVSWQTGTLHSGTPTLYAIAYGTVGGAGEFVAAGINGTIITSTDGKTWSAAASGIDASEYFYSVAFGNGKFVAAGANNDECYTWTGSGSWTEGGSGLGDGASGIVYANSEFVAVGYVDGFYASPDGSTWTQTGGGSSELDFGPGTPMTYGSINGQGAFVGVASVAGGAGATPNDIFISSSGNCNWIQIETDANVPLYGITYGDGVFVAVGGNATILTSSLSTAPSAPEMDWTIAPYASGTSDTSDYLAGICTSSSQFEIVGYDSDVSFSSPNGFQWTQGGSGLGNGALNSVEYGNGLYVGVDSGGDIYTSSTGNTWTQRLTGSGTSLNGVVAANGYTIAVGASGSILECPEGSVSPWTARTSGTSDNLNGVCFAGAPNALFVAVGDSGTILTTANTTTWTSRTSGTVNDLYAAAYGAGKLVAVGAGTILYSTDGINWNAPAAYYNGGQYLYSIVYTNSLFVAVGEQGWTAISSDGVHWIGESSATINDLHSVTASGGTIAAVGDNGSIMESVKPALTITPSKPPARSFQLSLLGWPNSTVEIDSTSSLKGNVSWSFWGTAVLNSSGIWQSGANSDATGLEFFRAKAIPECQ